MKFKIFYVSFMVFIFMGLSLNPSFAQTVHQVSAGENTLNDAIVAANSGDIIELIDSGGLYSYNGSDKMYITKTLTIRATEGLEERPIIRNVTPTAGSPRIFEIRNGGNLTLNGLNLDGRTEDGGAAFCKNVIRSEDISTEADSFHFVLKVENCFMHNTKEAAVKAHTYTIGDTILFENCIFNEAYNEAILLRESTSGGGPTIKYLEANNCSFTKIGREALYIEFSDPVIRFNHCTFDSVSYRENKRIINPRNVTDVEIKNCIFTNQGGTYKASVELFGNSTISYSDTFNIAPVKLNDNASVGAGMMDVDPLYTDPAVLDYTLQSTSPVLGMADDGFAMGDLRWDPTVSEPHVYQIEAGTDVIQPVINIANDGDILELVTSGGVYLSNDQIELTKDVIIRGREGLAQKPLLKYIGTSTGAYMFKVETSARVEVRNLDFDGDGTAEGAAALAKYALRLDNGDTSGTMIVLVDDCVMHDFNEKIIKPYGDCGIDSLLVHNTIFYNGTKEGVTLYSGSSSDPAVRMKYAEFVNCTFSGFAREGIKADTNPNTVMRVDHCTFYDCGGTGKGFVYFDDLLDVEIKNSIFAKNGYGENFVRLESDDNSFHHNVVFDVASWDVDNSNTVADTLHADPMFLDAANLDFTLGASSPARTAGEGGTPAGDLRWAINPNSFLLTIITEGNGVVNLDPAGGVYDPGTVVTLTAVPDAGWKLARWEGVLVFPPDNPVATITMDSDKTVKAVFESTAPKVTLTVDTLGLGHVELNPEPVDGHYNQGTEVILTAVPQTNWHFVEWLGDVTGSANPMTFTVDSNMTVTASFLSDFTQFTLNLTVDGQGSIAAEPAPTLGTYDSSTVVRLTSTPDPGWEFTGWSGDLGGSTNPETIEMNFNKSVTATFSEIVFQTHSLEIDTTWDLREAVEFANNNSYIDSLILITSGGVYTSRSTSTVEVRSPLTVVAKAGLAEKPIITNSDPEASELDIFRLYEDFVVEGVVFDGGNAISHGMKYALRLDNSSSLAVKPGTNVTARNCDFKDLFEGKDPAKDGHVFKVAIAVRAGVVKLENCTVTNTGYEAIRISDTEKWTTDRAVDSLIVRNCTFTNIDAECVRYYSDLDPNTPDAPVILEHITVNNSATRVFYLKNSGGAIVRDIIIANSRISGHGRDGDLMDAQGNTGVPSFVSDVDTFNVLAVPIKSTDGEVDESTIWGIDPKFEDAATLNYTLLPESHLYGLAHDGEAMGDLNWATNTPSHVTLTVIIEGEGQVTVDPDPVGKTYDLNSVVTLTAIPDSGQYFEGWSGDLSGNETTKSFTLDASKTVTAIFKLSTDVENNMLIPDRYELSQNYPNPFNPSTTIKFSLKNAGKTSLVVYDMLGREVATLVDQNLEAGLYSVMFEMTGLSTGVYFYKIKSGEFESVQKMILMK